MKGGFVLLGILLLAASIFGAKMVFDQPSAADTKKKFEADANQLPKEILCWGFFDVEPGVAQLNPRQFGDIIGLIRQIRTRVKSARGLELEPEVLLYGQEWRDVL